MVVPVMAISNLVLTQQIYSEETNGAHAHYREPVPLKHGNILQPRAGIRVLAFTSQDYKQIIFRDIVSYCFLRNIA